MIIADPLRWPDDLTDERRTLYRF